MWLERPKKAIWGQKRGYVRSLKKGSVRTASSANRTRASSMATMNSTTRPMMLTIDILRSFLNYQRIHSSLSPSKFNFDEYISNMSVSLFSFKGLSIASLYPFFRRRSFIPPTGSKNLWDSITMVSRIVSIASPFAFLDTYSPYHHYS